MWTKLLLILAVVSVSFGLRYFNSLDWHKKTASTPQVVMHPSLPPIPRPDLVSTPIETMLQKEARTLRPEVIDKVLSVLKCAEKRNIEHNQVLTVIDYSMPANQKRLWVFDLQNNRLLFNTYVAHGIKSGALLTNYFSNKNNSKSSSIGTYITEKAYRGRHGLSLQLDGLDGGFNDNAANRAVVMHGAWYVEENFINKYGSPGRSWGCPAIPENLTNAIINTIKEKSLFVAYYPNEDWFVKSKYLTCERPTNSLKKQRSVLPSIIATETRDNVLCGNMHGKGNHEGNEVVATMPADRYMDLFKIKAPLNRMLRRQINNMEYIALSQSEFKRLASDSSLKDGLSAVYFVVPVVQMDRGYYTTEMKIINFGQIKDIKYNLDQSEPKSYTVMFENKPSINLYATDKFIRWVGL